MPRFADFFDRYWIALALACAFVLGVMLGLSL